MRASLKDALTYVFVPLEVKRVVRGVWEYFVELIRTGCVELKYSVKMMLGFAD